MVAAVLFFFLCLSLFLSSLSFSKKKKKGSARAHRIISRERDAWFASFPIFFPDRPIDRLISLLSIFFLSPSLRLCEPSTISRYDADLLSSPYILQVINI